MSTTSTTQITVTCDMSSDLSYAGIGPAYSEACSLAEEILAGPVDDEDAYQAAIDTRDALDAAQAALVDAAIAAWLAAAIKIGAEMGYEVEAINTTGESVLRGSQTKTWVNDRDQQIDEDSDDIANTIEQVIWQMAHDAIAIDVDAAGVWTVETQ